MDTETVDKADPTNSNVYVGNLSAEARPRSRAPLPASQALGCAACRSGTPLVLRVNSASGLQKARRRDLHQ